MVPDLQPKRFPDLQPLRTRCFLDPEPACRPIWEGIAQAFPLRPLYTTKYLEPLWRPFLEVLQVCIENLFSPTPIQVDVVRYAGFIQTIEQCLEWLFIPATAKRLPKVVMRINDREFRL